MTKQVEELTIRLLEEYLTNGYGNTDIRQRTLKLLKMIPENSNYTDVMIGNKSYTVPFSLYLNTRDAWKSGDKIKAIRELRTAIHEHYGVSANLKETKDYFEQRF